MRKYNIVLSIFVLLFSFSNNLFAQTPNEVLELLKENNAWVSSVSCDIKSHISSTKFDSVRDISVSLIRDDNRLQLIGNSILTEKDGSINDEASHAKHDVMNGKEHLCALGGKDSLFFAAIRYSDYQQYLTDTLNDPDRGAVLFGRMFGSNGKDIYDLLGMATDLSYEKCDVPICGRMCHELKGSCLFGKVSVFVASEDGVVPLRWTIEKSPTSYYDDSLLHAGTKFWKATFDALEFEQHDSYNIPVKGRMVREIEYDNKGPTKITHEYEVLNVKINPDFEALGAFQFDLPSHVPVYLEAAPGIKYNYYNSQLVPVVDQEFIDVLDGDLVSIKESLPEAKVGSAGVIVLNSVTTEPVRRKTGFFLSRPVNIFAGGIVLLLCWFCWRFFTRKGAGKRVSG